MTALGSTAGYMMGDKLDRKTLPSAPLPDEGTSWRTCCCIGAGVPGLALGLSTFALAGLTMYGRGVGGIVNDPNHLTVIPAVLTGLCVTVEVVTIGYQVGRAIDRRNAEEAAAKRRALGPARDEHD
jgi:hypothetical protein